MTQFSTIDFLPELQLVSLSLQLRVRVDPLRGQPRQVVVTLYLRLLRRAPELQQYSVETT